MVPPGVGTSTEALGNFGLVLLRAGICTASSSPPCSYTSKKCYSCAVLYEMSHTSQLSILQQVP